MADAIAGLALFVFAAFAIISWIRTIPEKNSPCHSDCSDCPYSGDCPEGYYR
ncbi:MAG: FeoB-associated Cys-rich membrane protein [Clostridia bacterium]|nr:FeoB-associated Cys-rich membrane protein [Eubacterium sp.]MBO5568105.1 FeoB-associated Cys-rich membrane protein [Clostridia bacterium]